MEVEFLDASEGGAVTDGIIDDDGKEGAALHGT